MLLKENQVQARIESLKLEIEKTSSLPGDLENSKEVIDRKMEVTSKELVDARDTLASSEVI